MEIGEKIKDVGMSIGGLSIVAAFITIPVVLLFGAAWVSQKIFPWLTPAFFWTFAVCVFVLGPTALFRSTRGFSAVGLMLASYAFGFILWVWSFLIVLDLWGMIAVVIGLLLAGIGIVPIAILAALFHADWASLGVLAIMIVATFGVRILSVWLASKADWEWEMGTLVRLRTYLAGREAQVCAAVLLLGALANWPYGYYQFLRLAVCAAGAFTAWLLWRAQRHIWAVVMVVPPVQPDTHYPFPPRRMGVDQHSCGAGLSGLSFGQTEAPP